MEKISHIVRGSSRVASTDLKSSSAVRPGTPAFGRPMGESVPINEHSETTAARATAINNEITEHKKMGNQEAIANQLADQFFMTRIRRNEVEGEGKGGEVAGPMKGSKTSSLRAKEEDAADDMLASETQESDAVQPSGFKPRGSYVDVRA